MILNGRKQYGLNRRDFVIGATQNFLVDHLGSAGLKASIWLGKKYKWKGV